MNKPVYTIKPVVSLSNVLYYFVRVNRDNRPQYSFSMVKMPPRTKSLSKGKTS